MKARAQQGFWPLRPIPTLRRFELVCWLVAAILAVALTIAPIPGSRAGAGVTTGAALSSAPNLLLYRPNCIERILAHAAGKTEEAVANQINLQCKTAGAKEPSPAAGLAPQSCGRPFTAGLAPVAMRVGGCLGG